MRVKILITDNTDPAADVPGTLVSYGDRKIEFYLDDQPRPFYSDLFAAVLYGVEELELHALLPGASWTMKL